MDDLTFSENIHLKSKLEVQDRNLQFPLSYHERTGHCLKPENSTVQRKLDEIGDFARQNEMVINIDKTKVMLFNTSNKFDFMPQMSLNNRTLEVVEQYKLLGLIISSDLKFNENTNLICKRGYSKLYLLRRLKSLGAGQDLLKDLYIKQVRSLLEYAVPAWGPLITVKESIDIERVQKCALSIIYNTQSYRKALSFSGLKKLNERRIYLCENFSKKALKHNIFSKWFKRRESHHNTRLKSNLMEVPARTKRFFNSPIPLMTRLGNQQVNK